MWRRCIKVKNELQTKVNLIESGQCFRTEKLLKIIRETHAHYEDFTLINSSETVRVICGKNILHDTLQHILRAGFTLVGIDFYNNSFTVQKN